MKDRFRQSMAWLHTWVGLLFGWLLFFMFITGAVGYFDTEIDRWMQPELPPASFKHDLPEAVSTAQQYLQSKAANAERWVIFLPINRHEPYLRVFWQDRDNKGEAITGTHLLDIHSGQPFKTRDSGGGQQLYKMHWQLYYMPRLTAEMIVGVATMFMLLALITGIIVHKNIFRDFFTFRPGKGQRSWLDAHNLVSVTSLPFQLMITYSGLVFLMFTYMPLIFASFYGFEAEGRQAFNREVSPLEVMAASHQPAVLTDLADIMTQAEAEWGHRPIRTFDIRHPGDADARIIVSDSNAVSPLRSSNKLVFDGVSGRLLSGQNATISATKTTHDVFLGLHEGLFAPLSLRWLYFLSGLLGAVMIATGLILWVIKRRQRIEKQRASAQPGLRLVEKLNIGTLVGLPISIAAYFWANRLLPVNFEDRSDWEVHILFLSWLIMLLHASLRPNVTAWIEQLRFASFAFVMIPIINMLTTDRHLGQSIVADDWVFAGFDLSMLVIAAIFAVMAHKVAIKLNKPTGSAKSSDLAIQAEGSDSAS